jgi:RHS repeat-associated protein
MRNKAARKRTFSSLAALPLPQHDHFPHPAGLRSSLKLATGLSTFPIRSNITVSKHLAAKMRWSVVYSYRARWYLPEAGVFAERDPVGHVESPSLYAAFRVDPPNLLDPLGLETGATFRAEWEISTDYRARQRQLEEARRARKVFFLPRFDFVEAWYFTSDGVIGSTVTTGLVDLKGRALPLDTQAYLLKKHPFLPRYDNPGLVQLIRSPRLVKLTYRQQGQILLQWVNLNLKIVQVTGLGVALRGAILGAEALASTAYAIAMRAAEMKLAVSTTKHIAEKNWKGVGIDVAFFMVPRVVNEQFVDGIEVLSQNERYILKSLNDLQFTITEHAAEPSAEPEQR